MTPRKLTFFYRKQSKGISIQRLFADIRQAISPDYRQSECYCPHASASNPVKILLNLLHAFNHRSEINHITGDVHYLCLALPRKRTVLTVHDVHFIDWDERSHWQRAIYKFLYMRVPAWKCRFIVFISKASQEHFQQHVPLPAHVSHVIPDCVSEFFTYSPPRPLAGKARLLQVGTTQNKNLSRTIEALRGFDVHLRIIGKLSPQLQEQLNASGLEYSSDHQISDEQLLREYQEADIVLFPSLTEGFGMPIIEAQSVGRPVLTSDRLPMREVAAGAALLIDPEDVSSIRTGIEQLLNDEQLRARLIEAGLNNARQYHPSQIAAAYESLYQQIP
ncbi:glycosyltransferase family 1 protein [Ruficoccus sp. ZRK36]|uniref:glycosyltransferase family 4 protein n=1 Tax=Ruficoccus sp. ZRK36 TaxID=2866311 RepID=UPI001C73879F|nr:glycosyltransferase family 1 protein [Ruficoccus sp. ZRK36]QYY36570.1 glycosyltransferase family 4 protein [Ruficoccus sp. ZRK36]